MESFMTGFQDASGWPWRTVTARYQISLKDSKSSRPTFPNMQRHGSPGKQHKQKFVSRPRTASIPRFTNQEWDPERNTSSIDALSPQSYLVTRSASPQCCSFSCCCCCCCCTAHKYTPAWNHLFNQLDPHTNCYIPNHFAGPSATRSLQHVQGILFPCKVKMIRVNWSEHHHRRSTCGRKVVSNEFNEESDLRV